MPYYNRTGGLSPLLGGFSYIPSGGTATTLTSSPNINAGLLNFLSLLFGNRSGGNQGGSPNPSPSSIGPGNFLSGSGWNAGALAYGVDPATAAAYGVSPGALNISNLAQSGLTGFGKGIFGGLASGQNPVGSGLYGAFGGLLGNLGGQLGGLAGQGLLDLTGLEAAPGRGLGLGGFLSDELGLGKTGGTLAGILGQYGPTAVSMATGNPLAGLGVNLGLQGISTVLDAIKGQNISSNLAGMLSSGLTFGLADLLGGVPVVGPALTGFVGNTLNPTLAAGINSLAGLLGLSGGPTSSAYGGLGAGSGFGGGYSGAPGMAGYGLDVGGYNFGSTAGVVPDTFSWDQTLGMPSNAQIAVAGGAGYTGDPVFDALIDFAEGRGIGFSSSGTDTGWGGGGGGGFGDGGGFGGGDGGGDHGGW